jgi:hypothetical protein
MIMESELRGGARRVWHDRDQQCELPTEVSGGIFDAKASPKFRGQGPKYKRKVVLLRNGHDFNTSRYGVDS